MAATWLGRCIERLCAEALARPVPVLRRWTLIAAALASSGLFLRLDRDPWSLLPPDEPAVQAWRDLLADPDGPAGTVTLLAEAAPEAPSGTAEIALTDLRGRLRISEAPPWPPAWTVPWLPSDRQELLRRRLSEDGVRESVRRFEIRLRSGTLSLMPGARRQDVLNLLEAWNDLPAGGGGLPSAASRAGIAVAPGGRAALWTVNRCFPTRERTLEETPEEIGAWWLTGPGAALIRSVEAAHPGVRILAAGGPIGIVENGSAVRVDLIGTSVGGSLAVLALLLWAFRSRRLAWPTLLVLAVGVGASLAAALCFDSTLSPVSIAVTVILVGLAIDYPIHWINRWSAETREVADWSPRLGHWLFVNALTTAGAAAALGLSQLPGLRQMGVMTAAGLLAAMVATLQVFPAWVARHRPAAPPPGDLALARLAGTSARIPRLAPACLLPLIFLAFGVAGHRTGWELPVETDPGRLRTRGSRVGSFADACSRHFGADAEPVILLRGFSGWRETRESCWALDDRLRTLAARGARITWWGPASLLPRVPAGPPPKEVPWPAWVDAPETIHRDFGRWTPAGYRAWAATVGIALADPARLADWVLLGTGRPRSSIMDLRGRRSRILTRGSFSYFGDAGPEREPVVAAPAVLIMGTRLPCLACYVQTPSREGARDVAGRAATLQWRVASPAALLETFDRILRQDLARIGAVAAGLILLLMILGFHSLRWAFLAFVPVLLAGLLTASILVAMDIRLNYANLVALPLVLGTGVDDACHLVGRWLELGRRDIVRVVRETGRALLMTTVTSFAGFGTLVFARSRALESLGWTAAVGVAACLVCTLAWVVPVCTLIEKRAARAGTDGAPP